MKAIKIRVTDKQSIEAIQEYLFNEGYAWSCDDVQEINHVDCGNGGGFYGYANGFMGWDFAEAFSKHPYEEEFLTLPEDFKEVPKHSHYHKDVSHLKTIDVYRVIELWEVTSPSIQHALKKLLIPGGRGAGKDMAKDIQEAIDSLIRWQEMQVENSLAKDQQEC